MDRGKRSCSPSQSVQVLVENSFLKYGDRTAIEYGDQRISYLDVSEEVESIRVQIEHHGVERGSVVAVVAENSPKAIAAVLAVWASSCTLMLIDSSLPEERKEYMLSSVPTATVIKFKGVALDLVRREVKAGAGEGLFKSNEDFAYIAFTSGSTGKPKAIVGSHQGLAHFLMWQREEFEIKYKDRFAQFTNLSFDVWFRDVLTPLISGATVCIPVERPLGAKASLEFIRDHRISVVHLVPSIAALWVNNKGSLGRIDSLRYAFFAGEPLNALLVNQWQALCPSIQVVNLYGPTETTLAKHFKRIAMPPATGVQAVGKAMDGAVSFIMSEKGQVGEEGEIGEVCIATPYRSHGYFVDGELVSPFVEGLWPDDPELAVYRTGDMGRLVQDGEIELLGRRDDQVKVNGVRIDLAEVKSALLEYGGVSNAFICTRNTRFTKAIVAFVESKKCEKSALFGQLREQLPLVMVPSDIKVMSKLPKLPNGKIDRKYLVQLANQVDGPEASHREPVEGTACKLTTVWSEILERTAVSKTSSFFDVGGNSLAIVVLHERIEQEFGVTIPLVKLFQHPTIKAQVELIDSKLHGPILAPELDTSNKPVSSASRLARRNRVVESKRHRLRHRERQLTVHGEYDEGEFRYEI